MPLRLPVVMILSLKAEAKTMLCIGSERCDLQRIVFRVPFWNFYVVSGKDMGVSSNLNTFVLDIACTRNPHILHESP